MKENTFSSADKAYYKENMTIGFLATPNGSILEYNPQSDKETIISQDLPSDPNDPNRLNNMNPTKEPSTISTITEIIDWFKNLF